jgi:hypothetical protein
MAQGCALLRSRLLPLPSRHCPPNDAPSMASVELLHQLVKPEGWDGQVNWLIRLTDRAAEKAGPWRLGAELDVFGRKGPGEGGGDRCGLRA